MKDDVMMKILMTKTQKYKMTMIGLTMITTRPPLLPWHHLSPHFRPFTVQRSAHRHTGTGTGTQLQFVQFAQFVWQSVKVQNFGAAQFHCSVQ